MHQYGWFLQTLHDLSKGVNKTAALLLILVNRLLSIGIPANPHTSSAPPSLTLARTANQTDRPACHWVAGPEKALILHLSIYCNHGLLLSREASHDALGYAVAQWTSHSIRAQQTKHLQIAAASSEGPTQSCTHRPRLPPAHHSLSTACRVTRVTLRRQMCLMGFSPRDFYRLLLTQNCCSIW